MSGALIDLLEGDALALLAELEPESFDACVTDPPYGLGFMGREWDTFTPSAANRRRLKSRLGNDEHRLARIRNSTNPNLRGRTRAPVMSGSSIEYDFSPRGLFRYQLWCQQWASLVFRALKPGGYLVSFAAPRTYHRLACGVEDAGFEVRDSIAWIFGTGFPKSVDGEREVARAMCALEGRHFLRELPAEEARRAGDHVCDRTEASARFDGVGSALKPAHEPIILARKPLQDRLGDNLLAHGTGGLNVESCRVGFAGEADRRAARPASMPGASGSIGTFATRDRRGELPADQQSEAGRWPPNVVLAHLPGCKPVGRVPFRNTHGSVSGEEPSAAAGTVYNARRRAPFEAVGETSAEGWLCVDGCPVALLDAQSGPSETPETVTRGASSRAITLHGLTRGPLVEVPSFGDAGGASRYFPTFRYEAKPFRDERDLGCEDLPARSGAEATASQEGAARLQSPRTGAGRGGGARNYHPTVKPLDLMRWIVRLVARPGQRVLEPFAGSGTTPMACKVEGVDCVAIEREAEYLEIMRRRVDAVQMPALLAIAEGLDAEPEPPDAQQVALFEEPTE